MGSIAYVLVAEDDEISRMVIQMRLEDIGCRVICVEDGLAALEMCSRYEYDLVLLDLNMPMLSGFEAASAIRALGGNYSKIPIIAITASTDNSIKSECLDVGISDCIPKPIGDGSIAEMVHQWLDIDIEVTQEIKPKSSANASIDNSKVVDFDKLVEDLGGNTEAAVEIIHIMTEQLPLSIEKIQIHIANEDTKALAAEAHKLKGSAANVSANELYRAALAMEMTAKCDRFDRASELFANIKSSADRVILACGTIVSSVKL